MKILIVGPYSLWTPHVETDMELAEDHLLAGDEVSLISCEADMELCDLDGAHKVRSCVRCVGRRNAGVRALSGKPELGEAMAFNYRTADITPRQRAMLDFSARMAKASAEIDDADRNALREAGFSDADIWDIAAVASFYAMSNRMASATGMQPNPEYHAQAR